MIIASVSDYREAARKKLPRFLFDYIDGGAFDEHTLKANTADLAKITLRQRILRTAGPLHLETELLGQKMAMPIILSPVGLTGMYARRGEIQVAKAAEKKKYLLHYLQFQFVPWKRCLLPVLIEPGSNCMYSKTVVLCKRCWSVPKHVV